MLLKVEQNHKQKSYNYTKINNLSSSGGIPDQLQQQTMKKSKLIEDN